METLSLPSGDSCFKITGVQPGSDDGCSLGVADPIVNNGLVGASLKVSQDVAKGTLSVGTNGSVGARTDARRNQAMLTRDENPTLDTMSSCTWHQTDTSIVTITATDAFDIAVTETHLSDHVHGLLDGHHADGRGLHVDVDVAHGEDHGRVADLCPAEPCSKAVTRSSRRAQARRRPPDGATR